MFASGVICYAIIYFCLAGHFTMFQRTHHERRPTSPIKPKHLAFDEVEDVELA